MHLLVISIPLPVCHGLRCMQARALHAPQVTLPLSDQLVDHLARGRHELRKVAPLPLQRVAVGRPRVPRLPLPSCEHQGLGQ